MDLKNLLKVVIFYLPTSSPDVKDEYRIVGALKLLKIILPDKKYGYNMLSRKTPV